MIDPNSVSNPEAFTLRHASIEWTVDFGTRSVSGSVQYQVERKKQCGRMALDCSGLEIKSVLIDGLVAEFNYEKDSFGDVLSFHVPLRNSFTIRYITSFPIWIDLV